MEKLKISQIVPDPNQPRKYFDALTMGALKKSIKSHGIQSPIIVFEQDGKYMIQDGERRWRVCSELGIKEVPVVVITTKDPTMRLVEQFHIQEMHEGWTATEKAQVLIRLSEQTKRPIKELCGVLGITERTARMYLSFSKIMNKDFFAKQNISVALAEKITGVVHYAKRIKEDEMQETFTTVEQKKLERQVLENIKDGKMDNIRDFTKMKDTFKSSPKMIDAFMEGKDPDELYIKSKAKSAFNLRNLVNGCAYLQTNVRSYLEHSDVKPSTTDISQIRGARKALVDLLKLVDEAE